MIRISENKKVYLVGNREICDSVEAWNNVAIMVNDLAQYFIGTHLERALDEFCAIHICDSGELKRKLMKCPNLNLKQMKKRNYESNNVLDVNGASFIDKLCIHVHYHFKSRYETPTDQQEKLLGEIL